MIISMQNIVAMKGLTKISVRYDAPVPLDTQVWKGKYNSVKQKQSLLYLTMPLEHTDFHIIGYWMSDIYLVIVTFL